MPNIIFASPYILGFLAALPVLWWLLRLTPPAPKKIPFPALALLKNLIKREETPARTPWWLLFLRLFILSLLILAFAKPQIDPPPPAADTGDLLIVLDNDWAAARDWPARVAIARDLLEKAAQGHRQAALLTTTPPANGDTLRIAGPMAAEEALAILPTIAPEAWPADWKQAAGLLPSLAAHDIKTAVWIASGIGGKDAVSFYDTLRNITPARIFITKTPIYILTPPSGSDETPHVIVKRAATEDAASVTVNAATASGSIVGHWTTNFAKDAPSATLPIDLPPELRNQIARFEIATPRTAASTGLLDDAWEHPAIGITGDAAELDRHSLLSEIYYIDRALKPYADLHIGPLDELLKAKLPVIIMTDTAEIGEETRAALIPWLQQGGILARFSGERFAATPDHGREGDLLPVSVRGSRSLNGALSWSAPQKLQPFPATSPFHGLAVPADVTVVRQILAEPSTDLAGKTWAALEDGTPVVTAAPVGQGLSILFHVPARSGWSNLPLSGLFVAMLQKIAHLAHGHLNQQASLSALSPLRLLDAYGELRDPSATAMPLPADIGSIQISPQHPPGLYGIAGNSTVFNLGPTLGQPEALQGVPTETYAAERHGIEVQPYLLAAAFILLLLDFLISLSLRGLLRLTALLVALALNPHTANANNDQTAIDLTAKPTLAYVRTGDGSIDRVSEMGLRGLATIIEDRTSLDEVGVARIDPDSDDLAFYPLIYWPVSLAERPLSPAGAARVSHYLKHGGIIVFDASGGDTNPAIFLHRVLAGVDLPPLVRLPDDHVLKRSFYVLSGFPGRFADRDVWVEPDEAAAYDGVASVVFGSNGWAAAWAMDPGGQPLFPCTPGGEEQREYADRFGVNLVIYALTGTYKNDQTAAMKLLEKMGK